MTDLTPVETAVARSSERNRLLLLDGPLADVDPVRDLAEGAGLTFVDVSATSWSLHPDGVARACAAEWLGRPGGPVTEVAFCAEAVGDSVGAAAAWQALADRWRGDVGDDLPLPPDDEPWRRMTETLARVLEEVGAVGPRFVLVRGASAIDEGSIRALRALLAGRAGGGWVVALHEAGDRPDVTALTEAVERSEPGSVGRITLDGDAEDEGPSLPKRGSAVELLDVLASAPGPVPVDVVGSAALAAYRGAAPRAGWLDLQGIVDAGRAALDGPMLRLIGDWSPTTDDDSAVARADRRALRDAVAEVLPDSPVGEQLQAALAIAGGAPDAGDLATVAGRSALALGELAGAERWLADARDGGAAALRARATRQRGDAEGARDIAVRALRAVHPADVRAVLELEAGLACAGAGRTASVGRHLEAALTAADEADEPLVGAAARLALGQHLEQQAEYAPAAKILGAAAQATERLGLGPETARALARRAVCMGKAGAGPRAMKELGLARERASDPDDPSPASHDMRILMGMVFRDSGSRDAARKALALAAAKAAEHCDPLREAEARLLLARFFLEGVPIQGKERGEALRDGREAADAVVQLARGMGRADLEAEGETLLGELAWRSENFDGALESLERQAALWAAAGRATREVDVAIRRSRRAARTDDWEGAFSAANQALTLATKRRLPEQSAQAQLARAEALEKLDRGSDALAALSEAQRIYGGLGEAFEPQAAAAAKKAQQLVARGRG